MPGVGEKIGTEPFYLQDECTYNHGSGLSLSLSLCLSQSFG